MRRLKHLGGGVFLCALLCGFFVLLFYKDNKYQTPPPYGKDGLITLNRADLTGKTPIFLIDGWLLSDSRVTNQPTWIGEYSNLRRGDGSVSPHGQAEYRLTLRYTGTPTVTAVEFSELFSDYVIVLDGLVLAQGTGSVQISFLLTPGDHTLMIKTTSHVGYYSGMYYPPALGTPETLARMEASRSFIYALAFLVPLALALFTLLLWWTGGAMVRWFGLLCCFDALYVSYYFVQLFSLPVAPYWFLVENIALYGLCFCVIQLAALAGEVHSAFRIIRPPMLVLPCVLLLLCLLIPVVPWAVALHGALTDLYYVFTFCAAVFLFVRGAGRQGWEARWTRLACVVFGGGLIMNLFASTYFEPIRFLWQFEWCGLLLVILFSAMMAQRNRRILLENHQLTHHLEGLVEQRTVELRQLLQERKAFFSDMAHDLKAPVFATQSFLAAVRSSSGGGDEDRDSYLALAEQKQREMARRLQGLSTINALDKIEEERVRLSICQILEEVGNMHRGEAEVSSVHLVVVFPEKDDFLLAQRSKLELLFENLICNALRATPAEGQITISALIVKEAVRITVADTGCGISEEELPLVFRRFYVGERNRDVGTGLGLYIVQSITEEIGGRISVSSVLGHGTAFTMEFPLDKQ